MKVGPRGGCTAFGCIVPVSMIVAFILVAFA